MVCAEDFNDCLVKNLESVKDGGGYCVGVQEKTGRELSVPEALDEAVSVTDDGVVVDIDKARPSFCSSACYVLLLKALKDWDVENKIKVSSWVNLKPYTVSGRHFPVQSDGVGCWGRANANGPGIAVLVKEVSAGENMYIAPRSSYSSFGEYLSKWDSLKKGDFLKIFWNENIGCDNVKKIFERGHMVIFLGRTEGSSLSDNIKVRYWSSNGNGRDINGGYGKQEVSIDKIYRAVATRITNPLAFEKVADILPDAKDEWLSNLDGKRAVTETEMLEHI